MMRAFAVGGAGALSPRTHAARVCHSGSSCDFQCLPPSCCGSPPDDSASGCVRSLLFSGLPLTTRARTASKFFRDCSSSHDPLPGENGWRRMGVPPMWHETHRELPGRFVVKIGCTRVLKNSKSSDVGGGAGCCINIAAIGTKAKIGMTVSPLLSSVADERRDCISNCRFLCNIVRSRPQCPLSDGCCAMSNELV